MYAAMDGSDTFYRLRGCFSDSVRLYGKKENALCCFSGDRISVDDNDIFIHPYDLYSARRD